MVQINFEIQRKQKSEHRRSNIQQLRSRLYLYKNFPVHLTSTRKHLLSEDGCIAAVDFPCHCYRSLFSPCKDTSFNMMHKPFHFGLESLSVQKEESLPRNATKAIIFYNSMLNSASVSRVHCICCPSSFSNANESYTISILSQTNSKLVLCCALLVEYHGSAAKDRSTC